MERWPAGDVLTRWRLRTQTLRQARKAFGRMSRKPNATRRRSGG